MERVNYFLNITNHPSNKWSGEQTAAALGMAREIAEFGFPNIDPHATAEEVMARAVNTAIGISNSYHSAVVLIQGESNFAFALASILRRHYKYRVYAATSERIAVTNEDGTITKSFKFVQFREYIF